MKKMWYVHKNRYAKWEYIYIKASESEIIIFHIFSNNILSVERNVHKFMYTFLFTIAYLFDVYFITLQLVLVPCGGGRTSPRTSP